MECTSKFNKEPPKDHSMKLIGLGNTRVLIGYAQTSPRLLIQEPTMLMGII